MSMILDNSVSMAWCFEDEESPYSEAALESLSAGQAHVPAIWPLEVLNTLLAAERRHRISAAKSLAFVRLLARMPIHIAGDVREPTQSRTLEIGRALNLSAYDASYLELAERLHLPLASQDKHLLAAAEQLGVSIWHHVEPSRDATDEAVGSNSPVST